jgi:hypothetical protein
MASRTTFPMLLTAAALAATTVAPRPAVGQWVEERTAGPFQIRSEFSLSDSDGQQLVTEIGRLQKDVETLLAVKASEEPIQISLFRSASTYRAHLAQRVPEAVSRPALFVKGADMARVYVYRRRDFATDVRHECTHAVLHNALPYVPLWLDEGFAEYFEVVPDRRDNGSPYLRSLRRSILFGWKPNLPNLESLTDLSHMGEAEYRESWAWVHYMLHGPKEIRQVLSDYLFDIEQGNAADRLSDRLRAVDPDIDRSLVAHLRSWR